ncbi:MAG: substrate-binding domain-containing protein [Treponema sp.]|nr:substrate-binding domain-containing protein [Treponema sp.]
MNKNTIAFLTRSLVDATGSNMWRGIKNGCLKDGRPLFTFRGPVLNKGQGSIIYHLIDDNSVSGIISWASSDADPATTEYYKKYQKTPLICMTFRLPGHPLIVTDCKTGIMEMMDHLIDVHHFTKIAFIRGPEAHVYAKERYDGYLESLAKHKIPVNNDLVSPCGGWALSDGAKAVNAWIDKGFVIGRDIEAVVAVGDNVAIGAEEELISKGYSVPHDIAVCGFNGTNDAAWSNPPITTVEMPFYGLGTKGYETLTALMNNQPVPEVFRYQTKLVLGESCGCTSVSVKKAFLNIGAKDEENGGFFRKKSALSMSESELVSLFNSATWKDKLKLIILNVVDHNRYSVPQIHEFFDTFTIRFIGALVEDSLDPKSKPIFMEELSRGLNKFIPISKEFSVWQDIISVCRAYTLPALQKHPVFYKKADNLFQQARILINEVDCRTQKQTVLLEARKEANLRNISTQILSCSDKEQLMNLIEKSLPKLEISGCYVVLYNDCKYTEENHLIPENSTLILAVRGGTRVALPDEGMVFRTKEIVPDQIMGSGEGELFEVESLHYQDQYLGYIVFESKAEIGTTFSTLRDQISCSLYSALLLEERNKSRVRLERTMHTMTEKADLVSNQSEGISININGISKSMGDVTSNIKNISGNIVTVTDTIDSANKLISEANQAIGHLVESTVQIKNSIHMINDIAETTNVLSLNAAIEAAHAGDAGRGFSVVAKEVKSLAAQTVNSTKSIQELVEQTSENTKQTEEIINETYSAMHKIAELADNIKQSINDQVSSSTSISTQLQGASEGAEQISNAITEIASLGEKLI